MLQYISHIGAKEERFELATTTATKKPNQFEKLIYRAKTKLKL